MVAEQPLLRAGLVAGTVVRVGAQTGFFVDDVAAQTDNGNFALFQVKAGLSLGRAVGSPLAEALGQAVQQFLNGHLPVVDGSERGVDPRRDVLVLCTDKAAPATVRVHLGEALTRTARQPPGTPLDHELTARQRDALNVVLGHVLRLWEVAGHGIPADEQVREFFRALRVITVDANEGEADQAAAVAVLSTVLPSSGDATSAWPVLVVEGQAASVERSWRDRAAIGVALSRQGVALTPPGRFSEDIAKVRDLSIANLEMLASDAVLPVPGGLYIARDVSVRLIADAHTENVLVVGDAGAGKSAVAQEFATTRSASQDVVVLRAADIAGVNRIPLDAPLVTVLREWTGQSGVLVIDGVDALRGAEDRQVLTSVVAGLRGTRWQVVATARTFDARNNRELQHAFTGTPLSRDPAQLVTSLVGVRHLRVGELTDAELDASVRSPLALASLLKAASPELRALLRNPFNLRLATTLTQHMPANQRAELLAVRSRAGLLQAYWDHRVRNEDRTARESLLTRLCQEMTTQRNLRVLEAEPTVTATDSRAVEAMLTENVLTHDGGALPAARRVLSFSHNILFDYAAAIYLLLDPAEPRRLLDMLDFDPSLPLVARPSFDLLVDLLWEYRDKGTFWPLCVAVAESPHLLASLAFAARMLNLVTASDDLKPLAPEPGRDDRPDEFWPEQKLVHQLVGALRTATVLPNPTPALAPLATLARHLAENADTSYTDAALTADLLTALQRRTPLKAGEPGADDRGHAVAALLDRCRVDPPRMEPLAGAAARQLPHTVGTSAAVRAAVQRLLDDDNALGQWGGTVLSDLAEAVAPTAPHDPDLARRMAATILTFHETRDEQITFGGGVLLPLNESRRQQATHGTYRLGQQFGQLCAANLRVAAEIFCDLAEADSRPQARNSWPLSAADANGWLQFGQDMSTTVHGVGEVAASALAAALAQVDPTDAEPVVALLVTRLHNAAAWAALIERADDRLSLGRALLPALESGALLAHPDTHPSAAGLLSTLAEHEPALAAQLEAAVLRAHELIDKNDGLRQTKDALIGCLRPGSISSSSLSARLDEFGPDGPPTPSPRVQVTATVTPWSMFDEMAEQGVDLDASVEAAARALHDEIQHVRNRTDQSPNTETRLPDLFADADVAFASQESLPSRLRYLLVEAAALLARDPRVLPATRVGERVLAILTAAAHSNEAGKLI